MQFAIIGDRAHILANRMNRAANCGAGVPFDVLFADDRLSNMIVCGACSGEPEVRVKTNLAPVVVATPLPQPTNGEVRRRGRQPGSKRCPGCGKVRVLNARGNCGAC